jgi:hypothetical protein
MGDKEIPMIILERIYAWMDGIWADLKKGFEMGQKLGGKKDAP